GAAPTELYTLSLHDALPICGEGAVGRAGAAAHHGGDAAVERLVDLLRADEMDVAVDAARGDDLALAGDRLGARADDDVDLGLDVDRKSTRLNSSHVKISYAV